MLSCCVRFFRQFIISGIIAFILILLLISALARGWVTLDSWETWIFKS